MEIVFHSNIHRGGGGWHIPKRGAAGIMGQKAAVSKEKVTRRGLHAAGGSGETRRSGGSGLVVKGDVQRGLLLLHATSSSESTEEEYSEERLSNDRLRPGRSRKDGGSEDETGADFPRAFSLVLSKTMSDFSVLSSADIFSVGVAKDLSKKEGAPGPPKRIKAPLRTFWGTTVPQVLGEGTRLPLTKVPCALPQSTT